MYALGKATLLRLNDFQIKLVLLVSNRSSPSQMGSVINNFKSGSLPFTPQFTSLCVQSKVTSQTLCACVN